MPAIVLLRVVLSALIIRGSLSEEYFENAGREIEQMVNPNSPCEGPADFLKAFGKGCIYGAVRLPRTAAEGARAFQKDYNNVLEFAQRKLREW